MIVTKKHSEKKPSIRPFVINEGTEAFRIIREGVLDMTYITIIIRHTGNFEIGPKMDEGCIVQRGIRGLILSVCFILVFSYINCLNTVPIWIFAEFFHFSGNTKTRWSDVKLYRNYRHSHRRYS